MFYLLNKNYNYQRDNDTDQMSSDHSTVTERDYGDVLCLRTLDDKVAPDVRRMRLRILILLNIVQQLSRSSNNILYPTQTMNKK